MKTETQKPEGGKMLLMFLCVLFSGILLLSAGKVFAQSERFPFFADVAVDHQNFDAITRLMHEGVINGYEDGTFRPEKSVSRAEAIKILLLGSKISAPEMSSAQKKIQIFSDIENTQWYARYIREAKKRSIIKGRGDTGNFFPNDTVNRAEALKMLLLVNKNEGSDPEKKPYKDVDLGDWFAKYFEEAHIRSIFDASRMQNVYPAQTLSRGDLAEMMYRFQGSEDPENFTLMQGILPVEEEGNPENSISLEIEKKGYSQQVLGKNNWDEITLDADIFPVFRKGEIHVFSGEISGSTAGEISGSLQDEQGIRTNFSAPVHNGRFSLPVFFEKTGKFSLGFLKGKNGSYIVHEVQVISGTQNLASSTESENMPENFSASSQEGKIVLEWVDPENSLFHLQLRQNERIKNLYYMNGEGENSAPKKSVIIPTEALQGFARGNILITIRGAKTVQKNSSLILETPFSQRSVLVIPAYERFSQTLSDEVDLSAVSWEFSPNGTIEVSGSFSPTPARNADGSVKIGKGYVLNTQENLFEKPLVLSGKNSGAGQKFLFSFVPKKKDFYVLEISDTTGQALAVLPISPKGYFPVLPNDFDATIFLDRENGLMSESGIQKISQSDVFDRINAMREKYGRKKLVLDDVMSELAHVRTEDMKNRNYYGHYSPGGKQVNDFRIDFGIQVPLSENLARHSVSGLYGAYSLEFSPTHRANLLDTDISRVGIGQEEKDDGSVLLVELFGGEKISESLLLTVQSEISEEIFSKNPHIEHADVLQKVTQQWANTMAEKKSAAFVFDSGESWNDLAGKYKIQRGISSFVGSFPSVSRLREFIANESNEFSGALSQDKKTFAVSLAVSTEGVIFLALVGEE